MTNPRCYNCGREGLKIERRYDFKTSVFRKVYKGKYVFRCEKCEIVQADMNAVDQAGLGKYYEYAYRHVAKIGTAPPAMYESRGRALAQLAARHVQAPTRIFELGSGYGYNLKAMRNIFPGAEVFTDEPDTVNRDRSIQVRGMDEGPYDIFLMSHVLEHFTDPRGMVRRAIEQLSVNGRLLIEVPNDVPGIMPFQGPDEPHISFYTLKPLVAMLQQDGEVIAAYRCGPSYRTKTFVRVLKNRIGRLPLIQDFLDARRHRNAVDIDRSMVNPKGRYIRVVMGKHGAPRSTEPQELEWLSS